MCEVGDEEQRGCRSTRGSSVSITAENTSQTIVRQQISEQSGVFPSLNMKASGVITDGLRPLP